MVNALKELSNQRPFPEELSCCDNSPEFLSHVFEDFFNHKVIRIMYIQSGETHLECL